MNTFKLSRNLIIALSVFSMSACADSQSVEQAAAQYCEVYNPETWVGVSKSSDLYEIYNHIVTAQKETVTNKAFDAAVTNADSSNFTKFYHSARNNVETLLGDRWDCEYFDQFYLPSQTVVSVSLEGISKTRIDPNSPDTVVISISLQGDVLIGNAALKSATHDSIAAAVKSHIAGEKVEGFKFVLYADSGSDGSLMTKVLNSLTQMGVKRVSLIDY